MNKILILGSGALKIGQACEFDYSGSQAIKAFKEEGIKTVLINPNIATIQTSKELADKIYFLPVTFEFVTEVIKKEKPDAIVLSFGGQTALNCGMDLYKKGVLHKYHVQVLGTPVSSVILTEDREKFANHLHKIKIATPKSFAVTSIETGLKKAQEIGYPIMIRAGFSLGGQKSGIAKNENEFIAIAQDALAFSPQILVEKYLYHYLRKLSIEIVRSLKIIGECNVQFALNPKPNNKIEYYVIKVNARLSRS